MAGCGGNCAGCSPEQQAACARRAEAPRDRYTLADALARVIVDNRIVRATLDLAKKYPEYTAEDLVVIVNQMKDDGRINDYA